MSEYHEHNVFDVIADDISYINSKYAEPLILLGDFNSRTGQLDDCYSVDDDNVDIEIIDPQCETEIIYDIPNRKNSDKVVNRNGIKLIEMAKIMDLIIVNGRIGDDSVVGKSTCITYNGESVIDYALISKRLFTRITNFTVDMFDSMLSDVHCPIIITLSNNSNDSSSNISIN